MLIRRVHAPRIDFAALRAELRLPTGFSPEVEQEAALAVQSAGVAARDRADRTDLPFVTIDPPGSRDLDQAVCLERRPGGHRVRYAIADVSAFIVADGPLVAETWRRGQTIYLPDGSVPLHPRQLSEGAASLLPDVDRLAVLWTIDLDADGATESFHVERAVVRSRAQLDYATVQRDADAGALPPALTDLPRLGALLLERSLEHGAVNLPLPEQELVADGDSWRLVLRQPVPSEEHNAQISLLTGRTAAEIMLAGGVGLLRTMPAPPPQSLSRLQIAARALGVPWPAEASTGQVVAGVDAADPRGAAFLDHAAELMRGAGYTAFDGAPPEQTAHAGVGGTYAHVTAPLRRLADRYATEVALALFEGRTPPQWATQALPQLPRVMADSGRLAGSADRGAVDLAEATVLAARVGELFPAMVIDVDDERPGAAGPGGVVALDEPAVRARCSGRLPLGERVLAKLVTADPARREILFALAD
ncbi:RNB domain-containing ribonuclease [Pilimelia columellifera]|uniref:RNB domain-containing ribonuclease n=1 Tax=Pilimelia columellifera subsp. columellifera TaxID=706583 RepID=A0ABP6B1A5_9ACTN